MLSLWPEISVTKTVALSVNAPAPNIRINGTALRNVDDFRYLGCNISASMKWIQESARQQLCLASSASARAWENKHLTIHTKVKIFKTCALATLLYGSETWWSHVFIEVKLNAFHLRCLRKFCNVTWRDKIANEVILHRCGTATTSLACILKRRRLRWLGHVCRIDKYHIPPQVLYGELVDGKRNLGRPKLRLTDCCKRDLKLFQFDVADWETVAQDRNN